MPGTPWTARKRRCCASWNCQIQHKAGRWFASITFECEPHRSRGALAIGLDWGVETFATIAIEDAGFSAIENPRFVRHVKAKLTAAQQAVSRKAPHSKNRAKARRVAAAIHRKAGNRRHDFIHQQSAKLVAASKLIAVETLNIAGMTRSARGTTESQGKNVAQKAGLNREILATAPRKFHDILRYKAAEAGVEWIEIPTRVVKPSQTCSGCWKNGNKALSDRRHVCGGGVDLSRDQNAARVTLLWALAHTGREPSGCLAIST